MLANVRPMRTTSVVLLALLAGVPIARSNDSSAEVALGGLRLVRSASISMDSEELFISSDRIRVAYRFTNRTTTDVATRVVFPLPDVSLQDAPGDSPFDGDYVRALDFSTLIDGVPAALTHSRKAVLDGRDVTDVLARRGIAPLMPEAELAALLRGLSEDVRRSLVNERLIEPSGAEIRPGWRPRWSIRTEVERMQVFPAGRTVSVEHSYRPITGSSVSGALEQPYRRRLRASRDGHHLLRRFCIDAAWLRRFDRGGDLRQPVGDAYGYSERYVGYVLRTGANWRGPIRRFKLVVEQAQPNDLVATCHAGLRRVSPTRWEMTRRDFVPKEDLAILFIGWRSPRRPSP